MLDRPAPAFGQPPLAEPPPLILGITAPYPGFLIRFEGVLEALLLDGTLCTDGLGGRNVIEGRPGSTYRKEQGRL